MLEQAGQILGAPVVTWAECWPDWTAKHLGRVTASWRCGRAVDQLRQNEYDLPLRSKQCCNQHGQYKKLRLAPSWSC